MGSKGGRRRGRGRGVKVGEGGGGEGEERRSFGNQTLKKN